MHQNSVESKSSSPGAAVSSPSLSIDDPKVAALVAQYQAALNAGKKPDRSEFLSQCPEIADELNDCLDALEFVVHAASRTTDNEGPEIQPLRELGDFRLVREIGRGGMGVVYEAEQLSLGRRVAVKVLPLASFLDGRQLQRFKNEARAAALLNHPHIVSIHAVGCERSVHFYAMDLVEGHDLAAVIRDVHQLPPGKQLDHDADTVPAAKLSTQRSGQRGEFYRSVARLGAQAAEALHSAHEVDVIHRDIKPANLLLDRKGNVHITDFGLARVQAQENLTMTGDLLGTLRYMSPEQIEGQRTVDHRTDVYSLGLTLYELVVGRPAFADNSQQRLVKAIVDKEPDSLRKLDPEIARDLQTIIEKAISKEPENRYRDAQQLADDLNRFLANRTIMARPTTALAGASRFVKRNPVVTLLLATTTLLFALLALGSSVMAWRSSREAARRELEVYARDIQLANSAIEEGTFVEGERLLLKWVPPTVSKDHRGLEWYYLWQLCHPSDIIRSISHKTWCSDVAFSPDGSRLADAFAHFELPIWNLRKPVDAKPEARLRCKSIDIRFVKTFVHTNLLVAGDMVGNVYLWDWDTLEPTMDPITVHPGTISALIRSVDVHPSGRYLAIGVEGAEGTGHVEVFDLEDRATVWAQRDLKGGAFVGFDAQGRLFVSTRQDDRIRVLDIQSGEELTSHSLGGSASRSTISSDGTLIGVAVQRQLGQHRDVWIEVRDLDDWTERFRFSLPGVQVHSMCFSHDGTRLAAGDNKGQLWIANLSSNQIVNRQMHNDMVTSVTFSPDDSVIATTGTDNFVHLIRSNWAQGCTDSPLIRNNNDVELGMAVGSAFLDPDTVCTSREDRYVDIWNATTGEMIDTWELESGHGTRVMLEAHCQKRLLAAGQQYWPVVVDGVQPSGRVTVWDTDSGRELGRYKIPHGVSTTMPFSPDGRYLAVPARKWLTVIDLAKQSSRVKEFSGTWVKSCAFSSDGKTLACAQTSGLTHFLDISTLQPVREPFHTDAELTDCIGFLPGTDLLAAVGFENRLKIWDVRSGKLVRQSDAYPNFLATLKVSPDGSRIAVGAVDGEVRIFHTDSCEELISFNVPPTYPYCDFSPDGESLVVAVKRDAFVVHGTGKRHLAHLKVTELRDIVCKNMSVFTLDDSR